MAVEERMRREQAEVARRLRSPETQAALAAVLRR